MSADLDLNDPTNLDEMEKEICEVQQTLRDAVEDLETLRSRVTVQQARLGMAS